MDQAAFDAAEAAEEEARNLEKQKAARRALKPGEWACLDAKCSHINQEFRNTCDKCGKPKARAKTKIGREIGKDAAEKSKGLFAAEDWSCTKCGNINWARRNTCNICNAPKLGDLERRTGYGGGYMDREDVEYIDREDDEEFDEFGRKKKKQRMGGDDSTSAPERRVQEIRPVAEQILNEKENEQEDDEENEDSGDEGDLDKYKLDDDEGDDEDLEKYDLTADPEVAAVVQTQTKDGNNGDVVRVASPAGRADSRVSSDCSCSCSGGECSCEESDDSREPRADHRDRDRRRPVRPRSRSRSRSPKRLDRDRRHRR